MCGTPGAGSGLFVHEQQHQQSLHRRSSSVPLPNDYYSAFSGITLPSIPFLPTSRAPSPVSSISRHLHQAEEYNHLGHRRSSSPGAMSSPHYHQSRDEQWQWKLTRSPSNGIIPVFRSRHLAIYSFLSTRKYAAGITVQRSGPSSKLMSPHDLGPMDPFPDAMDWLTPAASDVDAAYRRHRRLVSMRVHLCSRGTTLPSSPLRGVRVGRLGRRRVSER